MPFSGIPQFSNGPLTPQVPFWGIVDKGESNYCPDFLGVERFRQLERVVYFVSITKYTYSTSGLKHNVRWVFAYPNI